MEYAAKVMNVVPDIANVNASYIPPTGGCRFVTYSYHSVRMGKDLRSSWAPIIGYIGFHYRENSVNRNDAPVVAHWESFLPMQTQ